MRLVLLGALAAPLLTAACIPDVLNTKPEVRGLEGAAPVQTLFDPESESSATLRPGGELVVQLKSNPTTGYYWVQISGDDAVISQTSEQYIADPAPEGIVGSGGKQVFRFLAAAKGDTAIILSYQRHADDVAEQRRIDVDIVE